jgi:hypothetical protein
MDFKRKLISRGRAHALAGKLLAKPCPRGRAMNNIFSECCNNATSEHYQNLSYLEDNLIRGYNFP